MNAEAVREAENLSRMQIRLDVLLVDVRLGLVGSEHVDPVGALGRLVRSHNDHAIGPRLRRALPVRVQSHDDLETAVAQILCLRMSLAAVAQDGDGLGLQCLRLGIAFIKNRSCHRGAPLVTA